MPIDYKKYHPNWLSHIRPRILTRDKFKCKHCGIKHKQYYTLRPSGDICLIEKEDRKFLMEKGYHVKQVILTIAHLDQDITNNDDSNLAALCQRCHFKHDKVFNLAKRAAK